MPDANLPLDALLLSTSLSLHAHFNNLRVHARTNLPCNVWWCWMSLSCVYYRDLLTSWCWSDV